MGGASKAKVDVALGRDQRADAAAVAVARTLLDVIADNVDGAIAGDDIEYLHQLRVAVRRTRTVQRQLRRVFPALELPGFRADFRWLQRATGPARDLDVYVEEFGALRKLLPDERRHEIDPVRSALVARRVAERARMAGVIRSTRTEQLLGDWERLLEHLVELPLDDRPFAHRSIVAVVGERVRTVYGRIVAAGAEINASSRPEELHELRKKGKELRYLLELFAVRLFDEEAVTPLIASLKEVQELLGRHQDREVQSAMLRSLTDEVAALPGGPEACLAMGMLIDRLAADELAARHEFAERFAHLAAPRQRASVAAAFS